MRRFGERASEGIAELDLERAIEARPHRLIVGPDQVRPAEGLPPGVRPIVFEPHDLQDVAAFVRDVGDAVLGWEAVMRWEREYFRPLARISENVYRPRPRVVAVVSLDPLVIARGHSFETHLIQYAGAATVARLEPRERERLERQRAPCGTLVSSGGVASSARAGRTPASIKEGPLAREDDGRRCSDRPNSNAN